MRAIIRSFVLCLLWAAAIVCHGQEENTSGPLDPSIPQEQPKYRGGMKEMYKFLKWNTNYPDEAFFAGVEGKVYVKFTVTKDGSVQDVSVKRGVHPALDAEAVRVVGLMPKWKPGKVDGKVVSCIYTLPIDFRLRKKKD